MESKDVGILLEALTRARQKAIVVTQKDSEICPLLDCAHKHILKGSTCDLFISDSTCAFLGREELLKKVEVGNIHTFSILFSFRFFLGKSIYNMECRTNRRPCKGC